MWLQMEMTAFFKEELLGETGTEGVAGRGTILPFIGK
jgi:hypothetical protein